MEIFVQTRLEIVTMNKMITRIAVSLFPFGASLIDLEMIFEVKLRGGKGDICHIVCPGGPG